VLKVMDLWVSKKWVILEQLDNYCRLREDSATVNECHEYVWDSLIPS
jgi:hypothetical protein